LSERRPDNGAGAAATLESAFEQRDSWCAAADRPLVGIFGNGMPENLIAAAGAVPVHLSMGNAVAEHEITSVIEPFVDDEVRTFLVRLMCGELAAYRGIVFARDDAPAMIAYQYATEWIRQDRKRAATPSLFLWNLVHTDSAPVRRFNSIQAGKLFDFLEATGLVRPDEASLKSASVEEIRRSRALHAMAGAVSGSTAFRWRNAGRFMGAGEHADLLEAGLAQNSDSHPAGLRIGLVGSPLASAPTYAMLEAFGQVVCDLQPLGSVWPGPGNLAASLEDVLARTAADSSCPRISPATAYRAAMVARLVEARCELVVCQLAQTDDTFGWEVPRLFDELKAQGIACVNLGFRDAAPPRAWVDEAASKIVKALEACS